MRQLCIWVAFCCQLTSQTQALSVTGKNKRKKYDYDLVVVGAGAAGMFAAGTASSFGLNTLLLDKATISDAGAQTWNDNDVMDGFHVGGDCTNNACVPSKAVRSVARIAAILNKNANMSSDSRKSLGLETIQEDFLKKARDHLKVTVNKVRARESIHRLASSPNMEVAFCRNISFVSAHNMSLTDSVLFNCTVNSNDRVEEEKDSSNIQKEGSMHVTAKNFIIATGATPVVPKSIALAAKIAKLPVLTYKTLFRPDGEGLISDKFLWYLSSLASTKKKETVRVVIAGGGAVACEVGQSLARLSPNNISLTVVAPSILKAEDVAARFAARKILTEEGVALVLGRRVVDVSTVESKPTVFLDDGMKIPADVLILAMGREPASNLESLNLHHAGVKWSRSHGIQVDSKLRSISARNIYSAGDCASAVQGGDRRASHAGWTGYHAVQSILFPRILQPLDSVHRVVPRVTFTDPEIASIGMSRLDCVQKYGDEGFDYLRADEMGTDRADMDLLERLTALGFVELRVSRPHGRILGATVCSPAASEIINEIGVALVHKMSCRDIARCLHAYPSHGYLLHRVSLSLALSDVWGILAGGGRLGRLVSFIGETLSFRLQRRKKKSLQMIEWEANGTDLELIIHGPILKLLDKFGASGAMSYLEASKDADLSAKIRRCIEQGYEEEMIVPEAALVDFVQWLDKKPM